MSVGRTIGELSDGFRPHTGDYFFITIEPSNQTLRTAKNSFRPHIGEYFFIVHI